MNSIAKLTLFACLLTKGFTFPLDKRPPPLLHNLLSSLLKLDVDSAVGKIAASKLPDDLKEKLTSGLNDLPEPSEKLKTLISEEKFQTLVDNREFGKAHQYMKEMVGDNEDLKLELDNFKKEINELIKLIPGKKKGAGGHRKKRHANGPFNDLLDMLTAEEIEELEKYMKDSDFDGLKSFVFDKIDESQLSDENKNQLKDALENLNVETLQSLVDNGDKKGVRNYIKAFVKENKVLKGLFDDKMKKQMESDSEGD